MKKEIEKYKLICIADDREEIKLMGGSLKSIDDFIYKNNIYDIEELSDFVINKDAYSKLEFKIIYHYNKETKEKTILYKPEIKYSIKDRMEYIENKFLYDLEFQKNFLEKFVSPLLKIPNNIKIKQYAKKISENPNNKDCFEQFLNIYTDKYKKIPKEELDRMPFSEQMEMAEQNYMKKYTDYRILRDIYVFALGKRRTPEILDLTISANFTNEFDELQFYDQNPDTGIRYPKYYIHDNDELEELKEEKPKKKVLKKEKKNTNNIDKNQISLFDFE